MRPAHPLARIVAAAALLLAGSAFAQKTSCWSTAALETDQLKAYQEGFNKVEPNIEIKWVRDSTGVITAKLLAEKGNPRPTPSWAWPPRAWRCSNRNGMLEPYRPLNLDAIMSQYRDKKNPPAWFGMDVWGATVCFNTVEAKKNNLPLPETWKDLTKPAYKGQVVMPNPASSGTGYFDVTAWLKLVRRRQRQGRRLEVHGRAAREHRAVHALRLQARANMAASRRVRGGHRPSSTAPTPTRPRARPSNSSSPRKAWAGISKPSPSTRARRSSRPRRSSPTGRSSKDAMKLYGKSFAITAQPGVARAPGQRAQGLRAAPGEDGFRLGRARTASASWPSGRQALQRQVRAPEVSPSTCLRS
jgi:iron(III) transport system substrate-binding protein